jgi:TRAP-type C4-dicarboxylate transport system permease small subunit
MMKKTERFWALFDKILDSLMALSAVLVLFITVAVTIDVLMRYAFTLTYAGLFEITEYSLLWMTFLGAPWIMKMDGHVRVDLVLNLLSPKGQAVMNTVASVIGVILLLGMTWYSGRLTLHDLSTNFRLSGVLMPQKWPIEIIIPIGFFLLAVQLMRNTHKHVKGMKTLTRDVQIPSDSPTGG